MSTRTIAQKLLIKPHSTIWSTDAEQLSLIEPLPDGVTAVEAIQQAAVALVFAASSTALSATLAQHGADLHGPDVLWVAYPKGNRADINRDTLWPMLTDYGLRPIGQVALNETWSALRFRPLKAGEAPFTGGR